MFPRGSVRLLDCELKRRRIDAYLLDDVYGLKETDAAEARSMIGLLMLPFEGGRENLDSLKKQRV